MPLFFVLAGLNTPRSLAKGPRAFLANKLWTVLYPYLLWSLVYGTVLSFMSGHANQHLEQFAPLSILWSPQWHFWFLYVLLGFQLLALLLAPRPRLLAGLAVVSVIALACLPLTGVARNFAYSLPFFLAGMLWHGPLLIPSRHRDTIGLGAAALGFAALLPVCGRLSGLDDLSAITLPATLCGVVLALCVARLLPGAPLAFFARLGRVSMTIFVLHIFATAGTRIVLARLGGLEDPWVLLLAGTLAGIIIPWVIHVALARANLLPVLGLAAPGPGAPLGALWRRDDRARARG